MSHVSTVPQIPQSGRLLPIPSEEHLGASRLMDTCSCVPYQGASDSVAARVMVLGAWLSRCEQLDDCWEKVRGCLRLPSQPFWGQRKKAVEALKPRPLSHAISCFSKSKPGPVLSGKVCINACARSCISGSTVEIMRRRMFRQVEVVNQFEIVSSLSAFLVPARLRAGRLSSWMAKHSQNFSMPQSPNTLDRQSGDVSCRLQECSKIAAEAHRSSKP